MTTAVSPSTFESLPPPAQAPLRTLKEGLESAVGANLAALIVYGSAVRGGFVPEQSDIDVIVVLKDTSLPELHRIAPALMLARYSARVEAMVLKSEELPQASDAFPLLYDDVRQRHVVLSGRDPFAGLQVADEHRRLRIEQELREARIRMRRAVVDAFGSEATIAGAVARKIKQIRSPLHALLCLKGIECDDRLEAVLAGAGQAYGLDTSPLTRVSAAPEAAHTALRALLDAAIKDADALEKGGRS